MCTSQTITNYFKYWWRHVDIHFSFNQQRWLGNSYDLFRYAFRAIPQVSKGYDSSFAIRIKHPLFKEKKNGKEGLEERKEEEK